MKVAVWHENDVVHIQISREPYILQSPVFRERLTMEDHHKTPQKGTKDPKNLWPDTRLIKHTYFGKNKRIFINIQPKTLIS